MRSSPAGRTRPIAGPATSRWRSTGRTGLLLLSYTFAGQRAPFPLVALNDGEAVIAGTGTGLGDAITAREEGGETFLEWAGLLLKRE